MSVQLTRAQLKLRALQRADMQNTLFIDQSVAGELDQLLDTELRKLHNLLADVEPSYVKKPALLSTVSGQRYYDLPPDFMRIMGLYYIPPFSGGSPAQNRRILLERYNEADYGTYVTYANWGPPPIHYDIVGSKVSFDPPPAHGQQNVIEYFYIPAYIPGVNDNDLVNLVVPGWEDYVVDGVAANLLLKEESPSAQVLLQRQGMFKQELLMQAAERDRLKPYKIQDTGWRESDLSNGGNGGFGWYGTW